MASLGRVPFTLVCIIGLVSPAAAQTAPPPRPADAPPGAADPASAAPAPSDTQTSAAPPAATGDSASLPPRIVGRREKLSHRMQVGLSGMPGIGYRVIFPYQEGKNCGDRTGVSDKRVCTNILPLFLDLQGSFGLTDNFDFVADVRLGLGKDFTHHRQLAISPGIRYWVDPDENLKFYATVQLVYDHTAQAQPGIAADDIAFRNANGLMYDIIKNFGLFIQFGETIGFVRWLRFELDGGAGLQLRFP